MGCTRRGTSAPRYWLSASVLTITSAPSLSAASRPAENARASPEFTGKRSRYVAPAVRATSDVRSIEPSSMTSVSTTSKPGTLRGRAASVSGRCASSLKQGIWMISFTARRQRLTPPARESTRDGRRRDQYVEAHDGSRRGEVAERHRRHTAVVGRHARRGRAANGPAPEDDSRPERERGGRGE